MKPVDVRIDPTRQPLSAGQEYEFTCMAAGSRPAAIITWWKGNKQMKNPDDNSMTAGDVTTSIFRFIPTVQDNNVHFSCRAHNPVISGSTISDGWSLEIHCKKTINNLLETSIIIYIIIYMFQCIYLYIGEVCVRNVHSKCKLILKTISNYLLLVHGANSTSEMDKSFSDDS